MKVATAKYEGKKLDYQYDGEPIFPAPKRAENMDPEDLAIVEPDMEIPTEVKSTYFTEKDTQVSLTAEVEYAEKNRRAMYEKTVVAKATHGITEYSIQPLVEKPHKVYKVLYHPQPKCS